MEFHLTTSFHQPTLQGVVYVDDLTIGKVIDGSRHVLVRFEKQYAWGTEVRLGACH